MSVIVYVTVVTVCMYITPIVTVDVTSSDVAIDGHSFTLTCTTGYLEIDWFRFDDYIGTSTTRAYRGCAFNPNIDYSGYNFKSCGSKHQLTLQSINSSRDDGTVWKCQNINGYYDDTYTITVTGTGSPLMALDGAELILSCKTSKFRTIKWHRNGVFIKDSTRYKTCVFSKVNKHNNYKWKSCNKNHQLKIISVDYNTENNATWTCGYDGHVEAAFTIYVHYFPRLNITEELRSTNQSMLVCTADGRPDNITFLPWKHYLNNQLVREVVGYTMNGHIYIIDISTDLQSDQGIYICTASNGVSNMNTSKQTLAFELTAKPTLYPGGSINISVEVGNTTTFTLIVSGDYGNNLTWFHNNNEIIHADKPTQILQENTNISHPYNTSIIIPATKVILEIDSVKPADSGVYKCRVCNDVGCSSSTFHVFVSIPESNAKALVGTSTIVIAGYIGAVGCVIIIVAVILVIVIFKRRCANTAPMEPIILENDMYISADLRTEDVNVTEKQSLDEVHGSIKPNTTTQMAPLSVDTTSPNITDSTSDDNACAVYSVVNKTNNTDIKTQKIAGPLDGSVKNASKSNHPNPNATQKIVNDKLSKTATQDGVQHGNNKPEGVNADRLDQLDAVYYNTSNEMVGYTDTTDTDHYINVPSTG